MNNREIQNAMADHVNREQAKRRAAELATCPPRGPFAPRVPGHSGKHAFEDGRRWCVCGAKSRD